MAISDGLGDGYSVRIRILDEQPPIRQSRLFRKKTWGGESMKLTTVVIAVTSLGLLKNSVN